MERIHRGFTLVELMIAVGALVALMAILLPMLSSSRELARRAKCAEHLRQDAVSTQLYGLEHDSRIPPFFFSFSPGASGTLVILVQPRPFAQSGLNAYEASTLVCPSDVEPGTVPVRMPDDSIERRPISYGVNIDLLVRQRRLVAIQQSSSVALFFDGSMSGPGHGGKNVQGHYHGSVAFAAHALTPRHLGQANTLFIDGHVDLVPELTEAMIFGNNPPVPGSPGGGRPHD